MINWRARVAEVMAMDNPHFSSMEHYDSARWSTCAIGEQHALLPEVVKYKKDHFKSGPQDWVLRTLGEVFCSAVINNEVETASKLLDQIDDRVLELKQEMSS